MKLTELEYSYPEKLVAKRPVWPRDRARLMVIDRHLGSIENRHFYNLPSLLQAGDVLVFNDSRVFPARIFAQAENGQRVEVVFLEEVAGRKWEVLLGGKVKDGTVLDFGKGLKGTVRKERGNFLFVNASASKIHALLEARGEMPLPPYMKRRAKRRDVRDYQTVFAQKKGSAAAPTAGLHFTKRLLRRLEKAGVQIEYVTLHVGLGTFEPVRTREVEEHNIHSESYEVKSEVAARLNAAKKEGRRIIACGTTSIRVLESAQKKGQIMPAKTATKLFITPGYEFGFVDAVITNFHTPKSSLLALVYAFAGRGLTRKAYAIAIKRGYRLFSYGDGMMIL